MIKINGNNHKLIFFDTNIIREISKNSNNLREKINNKLLKGNSLPIFSIHNIFEIQNNRDNLKLFSEYFSKQNFYITPTYEELLKFEFEAYKNNKKFFLDEKTLYYYDFFSNSNNLYLFFDTLFSKNNYNFEKDLQEMEYVKNYWMKDRKELEQAMLKANQSMNILSKNSFYSSLEKSEMERVFNRYEFYSEYKYKIDYKKLPAARIMKYSTINRIALTKKDIKLNDVMDVQILNIAPYVDVFITEKYQKDVFIKSRNIIPEMRKVKIFSISDFK